VLDIHAAFAYFGDFDDFGDFDKSWERPILMIGKAL